MTKQEILKRLNRLGFFEPDDTGHYGTIKTVKFKLQHYPSGARIRMVIKESRKLPKWGTTSEGLISRLYHEYEEFTYTRGLKMIRKKIQKDLE